ncbi:P-loop containing nucleoside triphosphate hydrolase protein [Phlyctochytrium arcticum]|nr:P-loop containing nucleoside triphosphate hydrolase protein [Phlyctochytrium arcticum]
MGKHTKSGPGTSKPSSPAPEKKGSKGSTKSASSGSVPATAAPAKGKATKGGQPVAVVNDVPPITQKQQLFGNWTGKTPLSLLHEQCQKNDWHKPQFQIMKKPKGYQCSVTLSKENKKTREVERVQYAAWGKFWEESAEAKHFGATYALHRICCHMSIHRLLPPAPRDFWLELEEERKALEPSVAQYEYAPDPFVAREAKEKMRKEKETAREATREAQQKPRQPWLAYPVVHMSAENRAMVEDVIRANADVLEEWDAQRRIDSKETPSSGQPPNAGLRSSLIKLGFRPAHVDEALGFCVDQSSALNWLCIHVPEDDLPPRFLPNTSDINTSQHTTDSLAREYAVKRLASAGFSRSICEKALNLTNGNELEALVTLSQKLAGEDENTGGDVPDTDVGSYTQDDLQEMLIEEIEALESIFGDAFSSQKSEKLQGTILSIKIMKESIPAPSMLEISIPNSSKYPFEVPALVLRNEKLPAYIRLSAMAGLAKDAKDNLLGSPMGFALEAWLEDNLMELVDSPPPLVKISRALSAAADSQNGKSSESVVGQNGSGKQDATFGGNSGKGKRSGKPSNVLKDDPRLNAVLYKEFLAKAASSEYQKMLAYRQNLPSYKYKDDMLKTLANNQVLIICGETGCGKSTQMGQFILDELLTSYRGSTANILCTQPRRISALSLAERVASERTEKVGQSVGYAIRGETVRSRDTRLVFCTTGILLRMVQSDPLLSGISHLIVDEVHERGMDSDFLLIIVRDLLIKRPDFRLILMSATVNSELFSSYFGRAPVFKIPGFTFPVKDVYLEESLKMIDYRPRNVPPYRKGGTRAGNDDPRDGGAAGGDEAWLQEYEASGMGEGALAVLAAANAGNQPIDYDLIAAMVRHICLTTATEDTSSGSLGAILVFLPGVMEIKKCMDLILSECGGRAECGRLEVLPLHANLTSKEQSAVFKKMAKGVRKVVVATNIAETSITIDDVVYVIDSGRVKEMRFNGVIQTLAETPTSRASSKQRRGRAGRVRAGTCFKLFSKRFEEKKMRQESEPEMARVPLEQLCLQVKAMGWQDVAGFLGKALDPPSSLNVEAALSVLRDASALDPVSDTLTPLGRHMADIPADLRIAKILLFGAIFQCLSASLTIAACMSSKSPFVSPMAKRDEAREARDRFASDRSDWITDCRAVHAWMGVRKSEGRKGERSFCEDNYLSMQTLSTISDLRNQYLQTLVDLGYVPRSYSKHLFDPLPTPTAPAQHPLDTYSSTGRVLHAVILAGLYPNVATVKLPDATYDQTAHGSVVVGAKAREIKFFTHEDGRIFIHPSSMLFSHAQYAEAPLLAYFAKLATNKTFCRDATAVGAWPLLMFGGTLRVDFEGRAVVVSRVGAMEFRDNGKGGKILGEWRFQAFARIAALVNGLRTLLDASLAKKIADPGLDLSQSAVVRTMIRILITDGK